MGDFADDLSTDYGGEIFSQLSGKEQKEWLLSQSILPNRNTRTKQFRISVVDSNMNVVWSETITASSSQNARDKFRSEFKDVRAKYRSAGGYMLQVKNVV